MKNKLDLDNRKYVIGAGIIVLFLIFLIRLISLQLLTPEYKQFADSNAFLKKTMYPSRGLIYDRQGRLLVYNQPAYDVMVIMREVQPFDTLDFCNIVGISKEQFVKRIGDIKNRRLNPGYSSYVPQVFLNQLSAREYGVLQEKLYKFPGFYIQNRTLREYNYPNAALVLGNVGEVNKRDLENDSYYVRGDYSGRSGVEKSYETMLRGEKGVEILLRDAHGRIKGKYENGDHDIAPESGKNLTLSLDIELQDYGERLMGNKLGGIVMIEPETGEVLCMVSSPTYDPSLLVGRKRGKNHVDLEKDPFKPLFNRPLMAQYPPGSTFKAAQGLVFLQENVVTAQTAYPCHGGYPPLGGRPKCHPHASPTSLIPSLATSCNAYYCYGLREMIDSRKRYPNPQTALDKWKDYMVAQGYGYKLGIDLPGEKRGLIPNSKFYDKIYKGRWNAHTIISISIGQGEVLATPLQICNLAATIANRGYFIKPHVVKAIEDTPKDTAYTNKHYTGIDAMNYEYVAQGMRGAVTGGTCRVAALPDIEVYGKTGTAENPHGKDHSIFMGFAEYKGRKVAISVFVENAGFGATYAVPIGRLMIEHCLRGDVLEESKWMEDRMLNASVLPNVF